MSLDKNNLICQCYVTDNYFIKKTSEHVSFNGRDAFLSIYSTYADLNRFSKEDVEEIIGELEKEQNRRQTLSESSLQRIEIISKKFKPKHEHVYKLQEEYLSSQLLDLVHLCEDKNLSSSTVLSHLEVIKGPDKVYRIPIFKPEFCCDLLEEISHFEKSDLPKGRPNTMNQYGVVLEEVLDLDVGLIKPLRERYLSPIVRLLYPEHVIDKVDSHRAFIVTYRMNEDVDLDYHYDNAEVTINISLDGHFVGGDLYFGPMKNTRENGGDAVFHACLHRLSHGLLHRGQHLHGAMPLEDGERQNLIIWMRCSRVRNERCPMCDKKPTLIEIEGTGDGFTKV